MKRMKTLVFSVVLGASLVSVAQQQIECASLCDLQNSAVEGSHQVVRVSGICHLGIDMGAFTDSCAGGEGTWVELKLESQRNRDELRKILGKMNKAAVVFVGEFYGPPEPDKKLPPNIKNNYHPGWGHMGAFRTKLVVSEIELVSRVSNNRTE